MIKVNSDRKWMRQKYLQDFSNEKFRKQFYFFTCILPDYVSHESLKEFWRNSHFENVRADFLRRCQDSLRQTSPYAFVRTLFKTSDYVKSHSTSQISRGGQYHSICKITAPLCFLKTVNDWLKPKQHLDNQMI